MSLDAKIDLDKVSKAATMKERASAALAVGEAVLEAADNACRFFRGSLELDITEFVAGRIETAKAENFADTLKQKLKARFSTAGDAPRKKRGRPAKAAKGE